MGRRRGFFAEMQREMERERVLAERAQRAAVRDAERRTRERLRAAASHERDAKRRYAEARQREVDGLNAELALRIEQLDGLLAATLSVDDYIDLRTLRKPWSEPVFNPGELAQAEPTPVMDEPSPPSGIRAAMPGVRRRHAEAIELARAEHATELREHERRESERTRRLAQARSAHDALVARRRVEHDQENKRVNRFIAGVEDRDPEALVDYFGLVLNSSQDPEDFPRWHRLAYVPDSRQLVVEYELPGLDVVPAEKVFRYVKAR